MSTRKPQDNLWFHVYQLGVGFFSSLRGVIRLSYDTLLHRASPRKMEPNHLLSSLHFLVHQFPKSFWKHPTGIGMGRSVGTLILYFFGKRKYFSESQESAPVPPVTKTMKTSGFTLIEMMISITLFSGILLATFSAFGNITQMKNKVVSDVDVYEQLYVAVENLTSVIKDGGDIDYEEYFNRSLMGTSLSGGHYVTSSGFGNFGDG